MSIAESALAEFWPIPKRSAHEISVPRQRSADRVKVRVMPKHQAPRWLPYVIQRLNDLGSLADNSSEEMIALGPDILARALVELGRFMTPETPTPSLVPTHEGYLQFVWHKAGWDIEVDVGPNETEVWASKRDGSVGWQGSLHEREAELTSILASLAV